MNAEIRKRGGSNLRHIREQRGITTKQLADLMAERFGEIITADAIAKYERGIHPISQEMTSMFASCLHCSVAALMDGLDLDQPQYDTVQELRRLSRDSHETFHWAATDWNGDIDALVTSFGMYAATPGPYRKYAMMELIVQMDRAKRNGDMSDDDIPDSVKRGIPHLEDLLGGLYEDK